MFDDQDARLEVEEALGRVAAADVNLAAAFSATVGPGDIEAAVDAALVDLAHALGSWAGVWGELVQEIQLRLLEVDVALGGLSDQLRQPESHRDRVAGMWRLRGPERPAPAVTLRARFRTRPPGDPGAEGLRTGGDA